MQWPRALLKTDNQRQEHDVGALTIWKGKSSEAALSKAQADRTALLARIAKHDADRTSQLIETDNVAAIDAADMAIAADRRAVLILDQRIAVIERDLRQQERDSCEVVRTAAIKNITRLYAARTGKGKELEAAITHVVTLAREIGSSDEAVRAAWPFAEALPHYFSWRYDITRDLMVVLYESLGDWMPSNVRQAVGYHVHEGSSGFTQVAISGPPAPRDLPGKLARNAARTLETLRKVQISKPEPVADDDAEQAA